MLSAEARYLLDDKRHKGMVMLESREWTAMAPKPTTDGLIVVLEGNVAPSLRQIAKARSLLVLEAEVADRAFQVIRRERPRLVIIQVGPLYKETLKLIRLVGTAARPVPVIAAATRHSAKAERDVLRAGATYYLPDLKSSLVEHLLEAVLEKKGHG